jgi:nitroreductase
VVITRRETIDKLAVAGRWMDKAGAVIAVVMDPASRWWVEDGAAAIENMLIASTALGYGACWVEGDALPHEAVFKALLGIPAEKRLLTLMPVGVPAAEPNPNKKSLAEVLHWEKY